MTPAARQRAAFDATIEVPFRMRPGLRRLPDDAPTFTPAVEAHRGVSRHLREKLAVFGADPCSALVGDPSTAADARAVDAWAARVAVDLPEALQRHDDGTLDAPALGWTLDAEGRVAPRRSGPPDWPEVGPLLARQPPAWRRIVLLSLVAAEDVALLDVPRATASTSGGASDPSTPPAHVRWMAVALPSGWAPERKVDASFAALHAPVPEADAVRARGDALMALVAADGRHARGVWSIAPSPWLQAHPSRRDVWPARWTDPAALLAQAWLRRERQTFLPLPCAADAPRRDVLFTIRVDTTPLRTVLADDPAQAHDLGAALASMSDAVLAYRGLPPAVRDALVVALGAGTP